MKHNENKAVNPQKMYHTGKYGKQEQNAPGVESKMKPVPDSGEDSYMGNLRLEGKRALITGGDSGIGRAVAIAYAREGAKVAINFLPEEKEDAESLKQTLKQEDLDIILISGDISREARAEKIVNKAFEKLGGLEILVLNAAVQTSVDDIMDLTTEQIRHTFDVNVFALMHMAKTAIPHMKEGSSIIITSSSQYFTPSANLLDYAASKSAVAAFGVGLAKQLIDKGIRVNVVCPGPVWTALEITGGQPQSKIPSFGQDTLLKRSAQPVEMAGMYVFLASDDASYVVGEIYGITGGKQ